MSHQHSFAFCCVLVVDLWAHMHPHEQHWYNKHKPELSISIVSAANSSNCLC